MTMIDEKQIDSVNIESNQIIFTDKSGDTVYKTLPGLLKIQIS